MVCPSRISSIWCKCFRDSQDEYITFEFDCRFGETLVFSRKEISAATDDILTDNGIRSQGSEDVLAIWNAHAPKK